MMVYKAHLVIIACLYDFFRRLPPAMADFVAIFANYSIVVKRSGSVDNSVDYRVAIGDVSLKHFREFELAFADLQILSFDAVLVGFFEEDHEARILRDLFIVGKLKCITIVNLLEGLFSVIAVDDDSDLIFLAIINSTDPGLGCTIKIFWRTKEISSICFFYLTNGSIVASSFRKATYKRLELILFRLDSAKQK